MSYIDREGLTGSKVESTDREAYDQQLSDRDAIMLERHGLTSLPAKDAEFIAPKPLAGTSPPSALDRVVGRDGNVITVDFSRNPARFATQIRNKRIADKAA